LGSAFGVGNQIFLANYYNVTLRDNIIFNNYTSTTLGKLAYIENGNTTRTNSNDNSYIKLFGEQIKNG